MGANYAYLVLKDFPFTYEVGPGKQLGQILQCTNKVFAQYETVPV